MLAAIRPDSWNYALFVHVLGAMILVGALGHEADETFALDLTSDLGGILLLISVVLAGFGARRLSRSDGGSAILARSAGVLALIVLALYLVALWAMTTKPG